LLLDRNNLAGLAVDRWWIRAPNALSASLGADMWIGLTKLAGRLDRAHLDFGAGGGYVCRIHDSPETSHGFAQDRDV
jgi:hypothetical protein